ncbi:hypothetical protein ASD59_10505 [Brevundimonas sp. Root608]|nr:Flp family type IVb pilin [Brevundimonas sp. Root608]KRA21983.1 hypothetical protein ASD59_10505 [Brevundimonas sp. Root608]
MTKFVSKFMSDESGATAIEYGLIAALIAVVIISAVTALGSTIKTKFNAVVTGSDRTVRGLAKGRAETPGPFVVRGPDPEKLAGEYSE